MERTELRRLLQRVRAGRVSVDDAAERLRLGPTEDLGFARLDVHRAVRRGFPEVIFGPGKTPDQIATLVGRLAAAGQTAMVTRAGPDVYRAVAQAYPKAVYHEQARIVSLRSGRRRKGRPGVVVVAAGTGDLPVAEEAAVTAELMGQAVERIHDVGVAGIHRLSEHRRALAVARVVVVVAGMEGALPSVIAGLTDCPVIGVPTSLGYGVATGGNAALHAMLASCAGGLTVVNVDNGFGAGFAASLINRQAGRR